MSSEIENPYPFFTDRRGAALDLGYVYIGEEGKDPELFPIDVFWDEALTSPAVQPLRTEAGYIVNPDAGNSAAAVYFSGSAYSIRIRNRQSIRSPTIPAQAPWLENWRPLADHHSSDSFSPWLVRSRAPSRRRTRILSASSTS